MNMIMRPDHWSNDQNRRMVNNAVIIFPITESINHKTGQLCANTFARGILASKGTFTLTLDHQ